MARISAFRTQIDAFRLGLQGTRADIMVQAAQIGLRDAQDINRGLLGVEPAVHQFVDGRADADLASVRPGGTILFVLDVGAAALNRAFDDLVRFFLSVAPIGKPPRDPHPGLFRNSLALFVNEQRRDAETGGAIAFGETDVVSVTNLQPYTRRIEKGQSKQAPNGVFEVVHAAIKARYGNILTTSFGYETYPGLDVSGPMPTIRMSVK